MAEHRNEMKPKRSIDERAPALASAGFREAISVSRECQFDCLAPSLLVHVDRIGALTNQRENSYRLHSRGGGCPRRAVTTDRVALGFGLPSEIGRAACREKCVSTCRSRWSPDH